MNLGLLLYVTLLQKSSSSLIMSIFGFFSDSTLTVFFFSHLTVLPLDDTNIFIFRYFLGFFLLFLCMFISPTMLNLPLLVWTLDIESLILSPMVFQRQIQDFVRQFKLLIILISFFFYCNLGIL